MGGMGGQPGGGSGGWGQPGGGMGQPGGGLLGGGMQGLQTKFNDWKTGHPDEWSGIQSKITDLRGKLPGMAADWRAKMPGAPAATPQAAQMSAPPQAAQMSAGPQAGLLSATPTEGGDWMSQLPRLSDGRIAPYAHIPPSMWSGMQQAQKNIPQEYLYQGWQGYPEGFLENELMGAGGPGTKWQDLQNTYNDLNWPAGYTTPNLTDTTRPAGPDWLGPNGEPPAGQPPGGQQGGDWQSQLPRLPDGRIAPYAHIPPSMWSGMQQMYQNVPPEYLYPGWKGYPTGFLEQELAGPNGESGGKWQNLQDVYNGLNWPDGYTTPNLTDRTRPAGPDWR